MPFKILYLGQNENVNEAASSLEDAALITTASASEALELIRREAPQVVLVDFDAPAIQPMALLAGVSEEPALATFIGVTQRGALRLALTAVRAGFHEVINLAEEPGKLQSELSKLLARWRERQKAENLHVQQREKHDFSKIIGNSPALAEVLEVLGKIIQRKWVTVLLRGEIPQSGTKS